MTGQQPAAILDTVRAPLAALGLDVEDVQISSAGRRRVVRVLVDKDGGVSLDDLADASSVVSDRLDASDTLGDQPYTLEVTSPGTDRPLTKPRHWQRNLDRLVLVTCTDGGSVTGRIVAVDEDAATLDVDGTGRTIPYSEVATARIQVEFNRPRSRD